MSDDYTGDPGQVIREMAHLSIINGKINPVQEKNLKMYPFVFFNGVTAAQIEYDLTGKNRIEVEEDINLDTLKDDKAIKYNFKRPSTDHFKVIYSLEINEQDNDQLEKRFDAISKAVKTLLWNNILVEVKFNNKTVYSSKK